MFILKRNAEVVTNIPERSHGPSKHLSTNLVYSINYTFSRLLRALTHNIFARLIGETWSPSYMPETDVNEAHLSVFGNRDGCSEDILDVFL
jgi:hypothetical protein